LLVRHAILAAARPLTSPVEPEGKRAVESVISQTCDDVLVAYVTETHLAHTHRVDMVGQQLADMAIRAVHGKFLVNFQAVQMMSSSMLGRLLALRKVCGEHRIELKLSNIADNIMQVFKITKLDTVFDIQPTEAKAIKAFQKKKWFSRR
jgi:anti-sigma B factor antagonist